MSELIRKDRTRGSKDPEELLPLVYEQLRALAGRYMRGERPGHTLRPTALVHEAYLRLADAEMAWEDRVHFLAVAANVMRRVLVDHARSKHREKRGGGALLLSLEEAAEVSDHQGVPLTAIDEALERLAQFDPRKCRIVELIYFGGLTYDEAAAATGTSAATVHRELRFAKAWIETELTKSNRHDA